MSERKPVAWLTYSWADDADGDVQYVAQQLLDAGVTVRLDKWNLGSGRRLWPQIEAQITSPDNTDGWILYGTVASLSSEACREEYAYALDRALASRGERFPIIGLFPGAVDREVIPAGLRTRLHVRLTDPKWRDRVVAAMLGRDLSLAPEPIQPYQLTCHRDPLQPGCIIEVRPRIGHWAPIAFGVPIEQKDAVQLSVMLGPRGQIPAGGFMNMVTYGTTADRKWWVVSAGMEATPTMSIYAICQQCPSRFVFGQPGSLLHRATCTPSVGI